MSYYRILPLLAAVFLLLFGQGLLWTVVPLSAANQGFSQFVVGLFGSAYHVGMAAACLAVPIIIAASNHLRAFAMFSTMGAIAIVALPFLSSVGFWIILLAVAGFFIIALDATVESWFHDQASNATRGRITGAYQIMRYAGRAAGPSALLWASPGPAEPFLIVAGAFLLALAPLVVARPALPRKLPPGSRVDVKWLYRLTPVAAVGSLAAGATCGSLTILTPVFAKEANSGNGRVVVLVTAIWLGAALGNWVVGHLGDRWGDRRIVLLVLLLFSIPCQGIVAMVPMNGLAITGVLLAAISSSTYTLYQLSSNHAVDLAGREHAVVISSTALLNYVLGATLAVPLAGAMMELFSSRALFVQNAAIHAVLLLLVARDCWVSHGSAHASDIER